LTRLPKHDIIIVTSVGDTMMLTPETLNELMLSFFRAGLINVSGLRAGEDHARAWKAERDMLLRAILSAKANLGINNTVTAWRVLNEALEALRKMEETP
jgi:hypothetical protein